MPTTTHNSPTAIAYARSLLELAAEQKSAEIIGKELEDLQKVIEGSDSFRAFLADPGISSAERAGILERVFKPQVSPLLSNFLNVVNNHDRLGMISQIIDAYGDLLDEMLGKIEVDVTVAQKLDPSQLEIVRQKVSQALGKDAVIHQYVDDSIIGGMVLRVEDRLIDASVKSQLEAMREKLLSARQ